MRVIWTGSEPAHRFASSTAVVTPATPPPTMSTRGASEVERRASTRPIGRRFVMVLGTRVGAFRFATTGSAMAGSGKGLGELLPQDHAGTVQPRLYRRN